MKYEVGTDLIKASNILKSGGVIAFPTETVFGLGVICDNFDSYNRLNSIKGHREDKPYTLMCADIEDISLYAHVDSFLIDYLKEFMPGPLTVLLKKKDNVPSFVTHGTDKIGIRIPDKKIVRDLIRLTKKPLLVPSANRSNERPCLTTDEVKKTFEDIDYLIEGDVDSKLPSTIIDLYDNIRLVRQGGLDFEYLKKVYFERKKK